KLRPDAIDITQRSTERGGFEPPVPLSEDTAFPVLHNRPLCHLSQSARGRGYSAFSFAFFSLGAFSLGALSLEALSLSFLAALASPFSFSGFAFLPAAPALRSAFSAATRATRSPRNFSISALFVSTSTILRSRILICL